MEIGIMNPQHMEANPDGYNAIYGFQSPADFAAEGAIPSSNAFYIPSSQAPSSSSSSSRQRQQPQHQQPQGYGYDQSLAAENFTFVHSDLSPTTYAHNQPNTPRSNPDTSGKRTARSPSSASSDHADRVDRRQRNTEAARRYRQRKTDRLHELEEALCDMSKERDELKLKLARSEAEADVLRKMVGGKKT